MLLGHEKKGKPEYFDGELEKTFSVAELLDSVISREDRMQKRDKDGININIQNQANPNIHLQQNQHATLTAQQQHATQEIKTIQGAFQNLKADILAELEIEEIETKEKKRLQNEFQKIDQSFTALEDAVAAGQKELDPAVKSRLAEFVDNLVDEDSRLRKALGFVESGVQKGQALGRTYNKFAPYFGLPNVPPIFLGDAEKK